ncbi:transposase [Phytohabitans sp. ZYX-F-186]|uniref:Transposase n=1 Tax=Phytohabitans maris TaxID=3071409 RepID=A0ABU0ZU17_9ACTN|nr:transposase [Phytohabitans sp. ZYX-F-186]MDQ7907532.1 transposase [Phytohabitans sp. ZYX-F-186]MDQ7907891.1 transposase [Phytohabitans sp. ZYX-F-186]MDQ7909726.1 transposase [Phytohabitans sp. ZYX-F-186]MDQ7910005.1 transposase [Phytohabitans sp. ZYX-F-186]MDQ7910465.1 transposase [Phytohabitans sp. ZYX-F-186]
MTPDELSVVRQRLEAFAADVFTPLARSDQRVKGETYLRGLLLDGRRKSMQPMAARLGVDHQGLQQFVTTSTWDTMAVRARLAERAVELIDPVAWVFDDTGFPKDGTGSPGVARQYSGTLGKVANCQIGVSVHAVTDTASCPLDWRLFLPESWDAAKAGPAAVKAAKAKQRKTLTNAPRATASVEPAEVDVDAVAAAATETARRRRRKAAIPEDEGHRPKWILAIEMIDGLAAHGLRPPLVTADSGYGDSGPFRAALDERGILYSVQVKGETLAHRSDAEPAPPTWSGHGRPPTRPDYPDDAASIARHVLDAGRDAATTVTWREGSKGILSSQFVFLRVRPAGHRIPRNPDGSLPERWLIAEWPDDEAEPVTYWLSSQPADTDPVDLIRTAKIRWRIEHDYRELKTGLGLDHFEGRSFTGWHRHVTLVTAAHLFITLLRHDPKAAAPA